MTEDIARQFAVMRGGLARAVRNQIGDMDRLIAATAVVHGLTLLTRNVRDFSLIPGLALYRT